MSRKRFLFHIDRYNITIAFKYLRYLIGIRLDQTTFLRYFRQLVYKKNIEFLKQSLINFNSERKKGETISFTKLINFLQRNRVATVNV